MSHEHSYERTHVHDIYDAIAPHFSSTRHTPWPRVASFLLSLPAGSLVYDIGCGNAKYALVNPLLHMLCSDRSSALAQLARTSGAQVLIADALALPWRGVADAALCIAVVHHFSTRERRRQALTSVLSVLGEGGTAMVYVWALEQRQSRRGWGEGDEQDLLVPWVMKRKGAAEETYQRYYHLFREGELEEDVRAVGGEVVDAGYERDNWWVLCRRAS